MGEELVEVKNEIIETSEEITPVVQFKEWFVDSDLPQIPFRQLVNRALQDVNLASVISKIEKGTEYVVKVPLEFKKAYDEGKVFVAQNSNTGILRPILAKYNDNMGSNGAGVTGGAGNPKNENGYDTYYLWEEVLQKDSLLDILHRFISHVKEKEEVTKNGVTKMVTKDKVIFPRYHQYDVVKKVIADVREKGPGTNYLIEHSAGSGKSNSIAWIAYRLASLHNDNNDSVFDSVIVVTNRVVLDSQLQDTINSFEHVPGLLECIDEKKHSRDLAEAINDKKRIIICTIQKFLFAYKDIERFSGRKFAIIVDEAHQGQSGESAKTLRRSLIDIGVAVKNYAEEEGIDESEVDLSNDYINAVVGQGKHENQSFFAFTATPKGESLELFGVTE